MKKQVECCGVLQIVSVGPWHHIDETWAWVYPQIIDQMCCSRMEHLMFTPHAFAFFNFSTLGTLYFKLEAVTQHGFHDPIHSVFLSWKMYHRLENNLKQTPKIQLPSWDWQKWPCACVSKTTFNPRCACTSICSLAWVPNFWRAKTNHAYLVGGWPTPLKNDGLRQLGWWNSQYMKK